MLFRSLLAILAFARATASAVPEANGASFADRSCLIEESTLDEDQVEAALMAEATTMSTELLQRSMVHFEQAELSKQDSKVATDDRVPHWASMNGDQLSTGASRSKAPFDLSGGPLWSFIEEGNGLVHATPIIDRNSNIYLATNVGNLYKFSAEGQRLWSYGGVSPFDMVPAMLDDTIFVTNRAGSVSALRAATGGLVWRTRIGDRVGEDTWSMAAGEGTVIAAKQARHRDTQRGNSHIVALDAMTGKQMWSFEAVNDTFNVLPSIKDRSVVLSDVSGRAYRLDLHSGKELWSVEPPVGAIQSAGGSIVGPNDVVYVASSVETGGLLSAINFTDGAVKWRSKLPYAASASPSVGPLRFNTSDPFAVVVSTGASPSSPFTFPPKETSAAVVALNATTSQELWRFEMPVSYGAAAGETLIPRHLCRPEALSGSAISVDGVVYVGSMNGGIYAIQDKDNNGLIDEDRGEVSLWDAGNAFRGSPGIAPGMLAVAPCNGLHVFKAPEVRAGAA